MECGIFVLANLDKNTLLMVKLRGKIAMNGKSSDIKPSESPGHWLKARSGKSRESASGSVK